MVVLIIEKDHVFFFELKDEPPIAIDSNCPMIRQSALKRMQLIPRGIHIAWSRSDIQSGQEPAQSNRMIRLDACF